MGRRDFDCICVVSDAYVLDLSVRCGYMDDITISELYQESGIELYGKGLVLLVQQKGKNEIQEISPELEKWKNWRFRQL